MAQASREKPGFMAVLQGPLAKGSREGALILAATLALYLVLSLSSYQPGDPGWSHSGPVERVVNQGGVVGAWLADVFLYLFGYLSYLFPVMVGYAGWLLFKGLAGRIGSDVYHWLIKALGFLLTVGTGCGLATLHFRSGVLPLDAGGILGDLVGNGLANVVSPLGSTLFLLALFLTGVSLFTSVSWVSVMDATGHFTLLGVARMMQAVDRIRDAIKGRRAKRERDAQRQEKSEKVARRKPPRIQPAVAPPPVSERVKKERQVPLFEAPAAGDLPPLHLLDEPRASKRAVSESTLEAVSRQVELKLADFNIEAEVVAVHPGPVVTRFELQPAPGLKVSKVTTLAKDLARSLSTISVRVVEVIPGKSTIGIELPNEEREMVMLSEILKSPDYADSSTMLSLALGKDISGLPVVVDLTRMPHLLVAGTTGSGKSVAINAMILSLLYRSPAEDVRMIMIDPKMLELSVYEGIPHLLAPVVTDMKDASNALRWCVAEMDRRYQLMSALGVRNIGGYNRKVSEAAAKGTPISDPLFRPTGMEGEEPAPLGKLPFIVVVVDELADLMMVTGKKVEELIARLAQKARAAGVHLILATQRPSVDVITGLIKANVPSRIAFQVSAKVDSRTILDQMGAEQLLGHGDMLYMGVGTSTPNRVHGAFVDDHEVHAVVNFLKAQGEPQYEEGVLDGSALLDDAGGAAGGGSAGGGDGESDPLYDQAVHIVTESRRASISGVQRRLKVGYNRAARMLEQMEESGVVGPLQNNGAREVLAPPPPKD